MVEPDAGRSLAVVVVNYGSSDLLQRNLVGTVRDSGPQSVVVVDNFSTADERERVRVLAREQGWTLVEPATNEGFGGGMNAGVARAGELGAQEFLLLNPDASIAAPDLRLLRAAASADPLALIAPRIEDGAGRTWFAGSDVYLSDGRTRGWAKRDAFPGQERWEWLSGACLLVTAEVWALSGGFDEQYFLYWEDVDFSRRVVAGGGRLQVVLEATAVHDEGGTHDGAAAKRGRAKSSTYYYFNIRNRLLFAAKHLDDSGRRRWRRSAVGAAKDVLMRGGRRQFVRPIVPLMAAVKGTRDGLSMSRFGQ